MVTLAFRGRPERDSVLLCNGLAAKGVHVTILVLREEGPLRSLVDPAVRVVTAPRRQIRYAILDLRRIIRTLSPSVVVSSGIPSLNLATLVAVQTLPSWRRPKLVLREGAVPSMARHDPSRSIGSLIESCRRLYRHADGIITLTDGARRDIARNFSVPKSTISVMGTNAVLPAGDREVDRAVGWRSRSRERSYCVSRTSIGGEE